MEIIKELREDCNLLALLSTACDVEILPMSKAPENEFGHLTYNIPGTTFAQAGSGSEYILLEEVCRLLGKRRCVWPDCR